MISDRKALRMAISPLRSREYWLSGLWQAVALAIAVLLLQRLVEVWILSFAQLNHAYFPLPLVAAGEEIAGWHIGTWHITPLPTLLRGPRSLPSLPSPPFPSPLPSSALPQRGHPAATDPCCPRAARAR